MPNIKSGDHGTLNSHNRWFILFYHMWGPTWIDISWNSIWLRAQSHMISHHTWGVHYHTTCYWMYVGTTFGHFLFGLSQFHGHGSWLMCEATLNHVTINPYSIYYHWLPRNQHILLVRYKTNSNKIFNHGYINGQKIHMLYITHKIKQETCNLYNHPRFPSIYIYI